MATQAKPATHKIATPSRDVDRSPRPTADVVIGRQISHAWTLRSMRAARSRGGGCARAGRTPPIAVIPSAGVAKGPSAARARHPRAHRIRTLPPGAGAIRREEKAGYAQVSREAVHTARATRHTSRENRVNIASAKSRDSASNDTSLIACDIAMTSSRLVCGKESGARRDRRVESHPSRRCSRR